MNPFKENRVLRFLGSIQMALPMILLLSVLLAAGTIVESHYSTPVAKRFVYGTWWFGGFLVALAVNLFCSAFSRFPWKKHQTGFVITHLGIITILAGSLVTQRFGLDGQIALTEGEEGRVFQEDKPTIYFQTGGGLIEQVPASFSFRPPRSDRPLLVELPDDGILMVDRFYLHARKTIQGRSVDEGAGFPAVHLLLNSSFVSEDQWLFLGSKEHGRLDLGPASVFFEKEADWKSRLARGAKEVGPNALAVLLAPDGSLKYQTRHKGEFKPLEAVKLGESHSTGWMDMQFKVSERLAKALPEEVYLEQPLPHQKDPEPALHYQVSRHPEKKEGWLGYQNQVTFPFHGKTFALAYGPRQARLPFTLHLEKFNIGFDPGTEKAASYASDVSYLDPEKGAATSVVISMNEPLHLKGHTVYQASYQALPDGKYISVFSVGKDPGIWLKYGGAIVMVSGIIFMFWFRNPAVSRRAGNGAIEQSTMENR